MVQIHNLGFPRIGKNRALKFALESFWANKITEENLQQQASEIRAQNWHAQKTLDYIPIGDFSLYDHVLDMSQTVGNYPARFNHLAEHPLDQYFHAARGRSQTDTSPSPCHCDAAHAGEMTKWFDTNYHFIVPELSADTKFELNIRHFEQQLKEAKAKNISAKPVIIGPITYLSLSKTTDQSAAFKQLDHLLGIYQQLLQYFHNEGVEWVQIDEPILVTELSPQQKQAFTKAYDVLGEHTKARPKLLLTTYFGALRENLDLIYQHNIDGFHFDVIRGKEDLQQILAHHPQDKVLSLGVIDGRNIWKTDLIQLLDWLEPIAEKLKNHLWLAPSCSLLHVPVDLESEDKLEDEIKNWLSFAIQKLEELTILKNALNEGRSTVAQALSSNQKAIASRSASPRVHNKDIKNALRTITPDFKNRRQSFAHRAKLQQKIFNLPLYPTTTIGSFPQTKEIRQARLNYKKKQISENTYRDIIKNEIALCIKKQEQLKLDVLVHGEAERNDMVEYFGAQLDGFTFTNFGWVQSYGSRCVKPPILFGDVSRPAPMTLDWTTYAQSLTNKPLKGMLTGPVTILNWSFVRDDQSREVTCTQLALALREEVCDLEKAGINIIQIDEAALREGLPLRQTEWHDYLKWAVDAFKITANGVQDETQIHTHMCYSEFNDIIEAIAHMDADVITIETSRSQMELLEAFEKFDYPNEIGPGVYDIHSPNIPTQAQIISLIEKAQKHLPIAHLWINPDCGLKTRQWDEVIPALDNMVKAAQKLRAAATNYKTAI